MRKTLSTGRSAMARAVMICQCGPSLIPPPPPGLRWFGLNFQKGGTRTRTRARTHTTHAHSHYLTGPFVAMPSVLPACLRPARAREGRPGGCAAARMQNWLRNELRVTQLGRAHPALAWRVARGLCRRLLSSAWIHYAPVRAVLGRSQSALGRG